MYSLRVVFTWNSSCLAAMKADMSAITGRHIRRAVDDGAFELARQGWTVGRIHNYALKNGLHVAEFASDKGMYTLRYENKEGERLNTLEAHTPKHAPPAKLRLPAPKAEYSPDGRLLLGHPAYGNHSAEQAPAQGALDIDGLPMPHEAGHAAAWAKHVAARHPLGPDVYALDKGTPLAPDVRYHYE